MSFWILLWKCVFIIGVAAFILMFVFVVYKGAVEIKELLNGTDSED